MENLYNICWYLLAQTQVAGTGDGNAPAAAAGEAAKEAAPKGGFFDTMGFMFPVLMAVMLVYFLMTAKPKNKAQAKTSELLATLKKNDQVVTAGGILGTVVNYRSDAEFVTVLLRRYLSSRIY